MRFSFAAAAAVLLPALAMAEDLLFIDSLEHQEYSEAIGTLGLTAKVVTEAEWRAMTTADFAAFKAIVIADPSCGSVSSIQFLDDTKATWSPAVLGNMVLIGTDPSFHFGTGGAQNLIDNAIKFAAAGTSTDGLTHLTGLYFALSCYYTSDDSATVSALSMFGDFTVRGNLDCYNVAHIVASSPALGSLDDAALSDWSCSVHEAFSQYPSLGINGFQALAIAKDIIGDGSQTFGDGTIGLPYIISRGATPAGCGDGKWDEALGEECDDGNTIDGDGCSLSCKCESGRPKGDGTCLPPLSNTTTSSSYNTSTTTSKSTTASASATISGYGNGTSVTYSHSGLVTTTGKATSTFSPPPYITPSCWVGPKIIGVEIIIHVTVIEDCQTIGDKTVTSTTTSACSTMHKPIYDAPKSALPCYICELKNEGITCPAGGFLTVSTTVCPSCVGGALPTPVYPVVHTCKSCAPVTLTNTASWAYSPPAGSDYAVPAPTLSPHPQKSEPVTVKPGATDTYAAPYAPPCSTCKPAVPAAPCPTCSYAAPAAPPCATCGFVTKSVLPGAPAPTGTSYVKPTGSPVAFTGGAAGVSVGLLSVVAGVILAIPMLL